MKQISFPTSHEHVIAVGVALVLWVGHCVEGTHHQRVFVEHVEVSFVALSDKAAQQLLVWSAQILGKNSFFFKLEKTSSSPCSTPASRNIATACGYLNEFLILFFILTVEQGACLAQGKARLGIVDQLLEFRTGDWLANA